MSNNREDLLKAASIVRPALASQAFVPSLTHLKLDRDGVTAYNDISALSVSMEHDLECCVPGDLFIKALNGFAAKEVKVSPVKDEQAVTLISGKGRVKLKTLGLADFPFSWPSIEKVREADMISFDDDMLRGIQRCLISVGANPNHPAQMGVTLEQFEGRACFFSTDNYSITRYETGTKVSLPADAPVILPTFFCEQLLALSKAFNEDELTLYLLNGAMLLVVGDERARLYSRQPVDIQPLDFHGIIRKHVTSLEKLEKNFEAIPDGWEDALGRALLVLGDAIDKVMKVGHVRGSDGLLLEARSDYGEHDEELIWKGPELAGDVVLNPQLVMRGSANCTHVFFGKSVMALGSKDARHLHLIAYYAK